MGNPSLITDSERVYKNIKLELQARMQVQQNEELAVERILLRHYTYRTNKPYKPQYEPHLYLLY